VTLNVDYRPIRIDEMVGNEAGLNSLQSKLTSDDIPRSYLFTGPPGCGKTTLAYVIKEHLGISDFDFYEFNTANTRGIDTIRDISSGLSRAAMDGSYKLYLLDECHQITGAAMEALLKILENPPKHVIVVLCTSEPEKIKPNTLKAVKRRCFELEVKALPRGKIIKLLKEIVEAEEVPDYPDAILNKIADSCWGSPGQALSLLDSVIDMETEEAALQAIENLVVGEATIAELVNTLLDKRLSQENKWEQVRKLIPKLTGDPESIRYAICGYLDKIILNKERDVNRIIQTAVCFTESFMYTGRIGLTVACHVACQI